MGDGEAVEEIAVRTAAAENNTGGGIDGCGRQDTTLKTGNEPGIDAELRSGLLI